MAVVVFVRGANLGKRRFQPSGLAAALPELDLVNIGAAGTFVVRKKVAEKTLRTKLQAQIPFEAPMAILTEAEIRAGFDAGATVEVPEGAKRFATLLGTAPAKIPALPVRVPPSGAWGLSFERIEGRVLIGVRKRMDEGGVYPGDMVEDMLGPVLHTARDWPTLEKILAILDASSG